MTVNNETRGWIFYDADCSWCARSAARVNQLLERRGFHLLPLPTPGTAGRLGVTTEAHNTRMHVLTADGHRFAGADAFVEVARHVRWAWPFVAATRLPAALPRLRRCYDWNAANRCCLGGTCRVPRRLGIAAWLPLLLLPVSVFIFRSHLVDWVFMWALMLLAFGTLTFIFAHNIAAGEPAARGLCLLMLVFWLVRLFVAAFVFDVRPYLTNWFLRLGYQTTNVVFVYLVAVYALAAWKGGRL